jgi:diguanylate cyclase (GGDEF)-like protein
MGTVRRVIPLVLSVALVLGTGVLGVRLTTDANNKAEAIHRQDRDTLQSTLAGLGKQYVLFSLKEGLDYASTGSWTLRPGDGADAARLRSFVSHAVLLNYGAALVDLAGHPLNAYAAGPGLPPPNDPGYAPMIRDLTAHQPNVSSVMKVGSIPVVAMGVPVAVNGINKAVFVGYVRLDSSALETYVENLHYGRTGQAFVVDSQGTVVAATDATKIGKSIGEPAATAALAQGRAGDFGDRRSKSLVSYAPFALGGWAGMTIQDSGEFFGPIRSGHLHIELAIVALLALASVVILGLGYKREATRRRYQEQLAYQAYHDSLTGLANRSLFNDRLEQALSRGRRHGIDVAVLYLDLDGFKAVNDQRGHEAGDALLVEIAGRVRQIVRAEDTVARMGGDEFAVVMEDLVDRATVQDVVDRLSTELRRPVILKGDEVSVGASVGVAYSRYGQDEVETLLRDADLAMYRAKDLGRGDTRPAASSRSDPAGHIQ